MHAPTPKPVHTLAIISRPQPLERCNNALNWRNSQEKPRAGFPAAGKSQRSAAASRRPCPAPAG